MTKEQRAAEAIKKRQAQVEGQKKLMEVSHGALACIH